MTESLLSTAEGVKKVENLPTGSKHADIAGLYKTIQSIQNVKNLPLVLGLNNKF